MRISEKIQPLSSSLKTEDLYILNAAYFLKMHQVLVTHIVDCEKIYIRLIGDNFSVIK